VPIAAKPLNDQQIVAIDVLALWTPAGDEPWLVLIENKRGKNPELSSRKALGQLLEYAATLSQLTPGEFERKVQQAIETPRWKEHKRAWDRHYAIPFEHQKIIERAKEAHEKGRFFLLWCADDFPRDFIDTLRWFARRLQNSIRMEGVDLTPNQEARTVAAIALARMLDHRTEQATSHMLELDRDFTDQQAKAAAFLLGKEVNPAFAVFKHLVNGTTQARLQDEGSEGESKGRAFKDPKDFLAFAQKTCSSTSLPLVTKLVDTFEQISKASSSAVQTRGQSNWWGIFRGYGKKTNRILQVHVERDGKVRLRFVHGYLPRNEPDPFAEIRENHIHPNTTPQGDYSRFLIVGHENISLAIDLATKWVWEIDSQLVQSPPSVS
jgi:hypothetical protein